MTKQKVRRSIVFAAFFFAFALLGASSPAFGLGSGEAPVDGPLSGTEHGSAVVYSGETATAVFAGGCFWCMEEAFEKFAGVIDAVSGYAGGTEPNPTYQDVAYDLTGHAEAVKLLYDPQLITYEELLYIFWRNIDPIDGGGQFCDRGESYRTAIFYVNDEQRLLAERSREELAASGAFNREIVTEIVPLDLIPDDDNDGFWEAESYHQGYYQTNPTRYALYKEACGRVRRLVQLWGSEAGAGNLIR